MWLLRNQKKTLEHAAHDGLQECEVWCFVSLVRPRDRMSFELHSLISFMVRLRFYWAKRCIWPGECVLKRQKQNSTLYWGFASVMLRQLYKMFRTLFKRFKIFFRKIVAICKSCAKLCSKPNNFFGSNSPASIAAFVIAFLKHPSVNCLILAREKLFKFVMAELIKA